MTQFVEVQIIQTGLPAVLLTLNILLTIPGSMKLVACLKDETINGDYHC